jgi:hypothetical protein
VLVCLVDKASGRHLEVELVPGIAGELDGVVVDNSLAKSFGWLPSVALEAGIAEVAREWLG